MFFEKGSSEIISLDKSNLVSYYPKLLVYSFHLLMIL